MLAFIVSSVLKRESTRARTRARWSLHMGGAVQDSPMLRKGIDTSQRILTGGGWLEFKRPVRVAQILVNNNVNTQK